MAKPETSIQSPCLKVCTFDPSAGLCRGCGRTLAEIEQWSRLSADQRAAIMRELPARLAANRVAKE